MKSRLQLLGTAAISEAGAGGRGVTAARLAALKAVITGSSNVMGTPRVQIVNRSALLKEMETELAALLEKVKDMDDLVVQFDGSDAGKRFIETWKRPHHRGFRRWRWNTAPAPDSAPAASNFNSLSSAKLEIIC